MFFQISDPRRPRGIRHGLTAVLTVVLFAVLAGAKNFREAGDRAADLPALLLDAAGTRRDPVTGLHVPPSGSTIRRVVEGIDADAADRLVCTWIAGRTQLVADGEGEDCGRFGLSLDGKTVRHSGGLSQNVKLFSAMLHHQAVVIAQIRVPDETNEITQVESLLDGVPLAGAVVTGDAAHAQSATAAHLVERDADYVLTVKANQPGLLRAIADRFADPALADHLEFDTSHGRRVYRQIWTAPADGVGFPGAAQVFRIRRDVFDALGQRISKEVVHGITSLHVEQATAEAVAQYVREHWGIENKIHWVRDAVFDEDAQHAYLGSSAHAMAMIRNLAIALIRLAGHHQIKRTLEHIAADRTRILPLLAASHA